MFRWSILLAAVAMLLFSCGTQSMKGWELYSWRQDETWAFALLPGTNRLKTQDEVKAASVVGAEALSLKVSSLANGEEIFWVQKGDPRAVAVPDSELPPDPILSQVRARCTDAGVILNL